MHRVLGMVVVALLALGAAACGGDDSSSQSTDNGGKELSGKIAVLLPDSKSSDRWENADRRFFGEAFKAAGLSSDDYIIDNAQGDPATQRSQAEQMITEGAKVILLVNLDSGSGAAIISASKSQGVTMIDYDRLTLKGDADYYVSGDATEAGRLQGKGLMDALDKAGKSKAAIAMLHGAPTDSFATDLQKGYKEVLKPKIDSGDYKLVADQAGPNWDGQQALTIYEQMLQKTSNKIDGVVAANDTLANSVIAAQQARKAANLAVQISRGEKPTGIETEVDNGAKKVPTISLKTVTVTKDNIADTVIADDFVSWKDVCTGKYKQY